MLYLFFSLFYFSGLCVLKRAVQIVVITTIITIIIIIIMVKAVFCLQDG